MITGTVSVGGSHGGCGSPTDGDVVIGTAASGGFPGGSTDNGGEQPGTCAIENASAILPRGTDSTAGVLSVAIGVLITMAAATLVLRKRMS